MLATISATLSRKKAIWREQSPNSAKSCRLEPDRPDGHGNLGNALRRKGDLEGAIAELRQAVNLEPGRPEAHYNLGDTLKDKGDLDGAIAEYRQAWRLKPDFTKAHDNLSRALPQG